MPFLVSTLQRLLLGIFILFGYLLLGWIPLTLYITRCVCVCLYKWMGWGWYIMLFSCRATLHTIMSVSMFVCPRL